MAKNRMNYTGRKFGLLKVIDCVEASTGSNKGGQWLCMCKCRRTITLGGYQLHSRNSCGCLGRKAAVERGKALRKTDEEKAMNAAYRTYRKDKSLVIPLSKVQWKELIIRACDYCGDQKQQNFVSEEYRTICESCKEIKGQFPHLIFVEKIEQILQYLSKK
jgi:hypothetical protein